MAYNIRFRTHKAFVSGYKFLLKKGFVFTTDRINRFDSNHVALSYKAIFVGHNPDGCGCKMIMNTGFDYWYGSDSNNWIDISMNKFVKEVLPNW